MADEEMSKSEGAAVTSVLNGALVRIALRYGAGYLLGATTGAALADDADLVMLIGLAVAAMVEGFYSMAKRKGWRL